MFKTTNNTNRLETESSFLMKIWYFLEQDLLIWTCFVDLSSVKPFMFDRKDENVADNITDLKESEARYKALFDRTLYCVYVHNFEGKFLDANEAALKLLGYTRAEIPSLGFHTILDKDQLPTAIKATEEVLKNGSLKNPVEIKLRKRNGEYVWVETEASLIYRDGAPYLSLIHI